MELSALGFDDGFERHAAGLLQPGHSLARVTTVARGAFLVHDGAAETPAELVGKFRFGNPAAAEVPCVGDWVCVRRESLGGPAVIHGILPRRTFLRRKSPGRTVDYQMIAANVDVAFVVQGCQYDLSAARLERYMVMADEGHIELRIVLSKTDLISAAELQQRTEQIRCRGCSAQILPLSNTLGDGLEEFRALLLPGKTYCLLGSSGVGKTTLINRLLGREAFETKAVSATGEGVHTTARRHLLVLECGALFIDTPGMRELGLLGTTDGMNATFAAIADFSTGCRFSNCTHTQEPGCAVRSAVESGDLSEDRYQNYLKLRKETEYHGLSYAEKRKENRAFGRFKSAAKPMKD